MTSAKPAVSDLPEPSSQPAPGVHGATGRDRWFLVWMVALLLGLFGPRVYLIVQARTALIDSDEAITGLMARHILQGHVPIWLYGISYQGSLEAFSTAVLFAVFGATPLILKVEPSCWFCGFVGVHYLFAREVADRTTARWSTLAVAVSPAFLTIWSVSVVGTYMSPLCLGTVALLLTVRVLRRGCRRTRLGSARGRDGPGLVDIPAGHRLHRSDPLLLIAAHSRRRWCPGWRWPCRWDSSWEACPSGRTT